MPSPRSTPTAAKRASRRSGDVFVSAGEISGDRIAAPVVQQLRQRFPLLRFFGAGGAALQSAGVEIRHAVDDLAVTGISELAGSASAVASLLFDTRRHLEQRKTVLALLVDYPGANLRLARMLSGRGVPVLYYSAPQRWAWLPERARAMADIVDQLAVTLPFEQQWFAARGVRATFVGHPLLDTFSLPSRRQAARTITLDGRPVLAILPGSRPNEVQRHLPLVLKALEWLPGVQPVVAVVPGAHQSLCQRLAPRLPQLPSEEAFALADVALCASGSATLEAALAGVPTAVFYRLSWFSGALAKQLVNVPYVALPNLLLSDQVMPELLQQAATPGALAMAVRQLLEPSRAAQQRRRLRDAAMMLGEPGAARRVADLAERLLVRRKRRL